MEARSASFERVEGKLIVFTAHTFPLVIVQIQATIIEEVVGVVKHRSW
jgi:hypothetical protein